MPDELTIDTDAYFKTLSMQRNNAMDAVAQLEGAIATLRRENAALRQQLESASAKSATPDLYTTPKPEPEAATPPPQ